MTHACGTLAFVRGAPEAQKVTSKMVKSISIRPLSKIFVMTTILLT